MRRDKLTNRNLDSMVFDWLSSSTSACDSDILVNFRWIVGDGFVSEIGKFTTLCFLITTPTHTLSQTSLI